MPRKKSTSKCKATSNKGWTDRVDDFALWGSEDEEVLRDDRPFLQSAPRVHAGSQSTASMLVAGERRALGQVDAPAAPVRPVRDVEDSFGGGFTAASKLLNTTSTPTDTVAQTPARVATPVNATRTPWQYTRTTTQPSVPAVSRSMPTAPSVNAAQAPPRDDGLPQYAFRKPKAIRDPIQQTIRTPFAEVVNVDTRREVGVSPHVAPHRSPFQPPERRVPSSSSSSSRRHDGSSASSSRMPSSSSPYTSSLSFSDKSGRSSSLSKKQPSAHPRLPSKVRVPSKVTCVPGITNQSQLAFVPIKQSSPRGEQSYSPPPSNVPRRSTATPQQSALPQSSARHRSSPQRFTPRHRLYHSAGFDPEPISYRRDQRGAARPAHHPMAHQAAMWAPSSSSRSALDYAVDREFYQSFQSSPVRERIQMDYEASRSGGSSRLWQTQDRSEEERRVRQYPKVFDADPARSLKQSKQKLSSFEWSTRQEGLAVRNRILPATPRQGAASRWNRDLMALTIREQEERERQQRQQQTPRPATMSFVGTHDQAISISSDEFDEFDMDGIQEEDLARLEARHTIAR